MVIRKAVLTAVCTFALMAACSAPENVDDTASEVEATIELGEPVTSLSAIEGFWLVERFGEFEPSWQNEVPWRRAYVEIGPRGFTYSIGCNRSGNSARIGTGGILEDTGNGVRTQTLMGCGNEVEKRDTRFSSFFGSGPQVLRLGEHRLLLSSKAGELVLVDPEAWRLANIPDFDFVTQRWVPRMTLSYDGWQSTGFGIGAGGDVDTGVITIAPDRIVWSRCPDSPVAIAWSESGRLRNTGGDTAPCRAVTRATRDGPQQVMAMLVSDPAVIRTGSHEIALIAGTGAKGTAIYLQSEESVLDPAPPPPLPEDAVRPTPPPTPPAPTSATD
ncbi:hypothetical protein [Erythrobacter litoralis]|uniref:DUF306 domain-containing protein n=1 Tax=Erythrobacter litoralis (strain HTCC2594) TaxID=314225 RepID=Q2N9G8_ERYLH|nr:hypothetical protein [Erythrobacter litoralis]ABC63673.1 hypothetical protein ELI_07905 [Erythrobacter litoralis HTCC2594]